MLQVTTAQLDAFSDASKRHYRDRVCNFLRDQLFTGQFLEPVTLAIQVSEQIDRARIFGLHTEYEVVSYVLAAQIIHPDFDQNPKILEYLLSDRPSGQKARFLEAVVSRTIAIAKGPA